MERGLRVGRNLPLTLTGLFILTCVEMFTAGGIIQSTTETVSLFQWTIALAALGSGLLRLRLAELSRLWRRG